jgi:hypothetical protein
MKRRREGGQHVSIEVISRIIANVNFWSDSVTFLRPHFFPKKMDVRQFLGKSERDLLTSVGTTAQWGNDGEIPGESGKNGLRVREIRH